MIEQILLEQHQRYYELDNSNHQTSRELMAVVLESRVTMNRALIGVQIRGFAWQIEGNIVNPLSEV